MAIMFVTGVNDRGLLQVYQDDNLQMQFEIDGSCNVLNKIDLGSIPKMPVLIYGPNSPARPIRLPHKPRLIFNQISDADSHVTALERCIKLCDGMGIPVINHPSAILRTSREQTSQSLQGIEGLTVPKTIRCQPENPDHVFEIAKTNGIEFPFIQRSVGEHNGANMMVIHGLEDREKLHHYAFDGSSYFLIEYLDTRNEHGHYHKQRIAVIDGKPLLRHALFNENWMVHANSVEFMKQHETSEEELERMRVITDEKIPPLRPLFKEIADRLELEYFGIDCNIGNDGTVVLFEVNANMNILLDKRLPLSPIVQGISRELANMVTARFKQL